jgi:hypothetical protein
VNGKALSRDEFDELFFSLRRPVLLTALLDDWPAQRRWAKQSFLDSYGYFAVASARIPYAGTYGMPSDASTIFDFVKTHMSDEFSNTSESVAPFASTAPAQYVFEGGLFRKRNAHGHSFAQDTSPLPALLTSVISGGVYLEQFALGPPLAGAQSHFHGDAFNALVAGSKRWLLTPSPDGLFSRASAYDEMMAHMQKSRLFPAGNHSANPPQYWAPDPDLVRHSECVQAAGEVLFVPEMYSHSTLVLQDALAVAIEFA